MLPFLYICSFAIEAAAQAQQALPIKEATRNRSDHVAVHLGETMVVRGVVTDEPHDVGSGSSLANLQDSTGGIALFGATQCCRQQVLSGGTYLRPAANWRSTGEWRNSNWRLFVEPAPPPLLLCTSPPSSCAARSSPASWFAAKGQIVLLPNGGIALRDNSGEIPVYMLRSFFQHANFMQRLLQGGQVEIVGFARQRINDGEPPDSGYVLSPRDELDFKFAPLTRYRETAAVALVVLGLLPLSLAAPPRR